MLIICPHLPPRLKKEYTYTSAPLLGLHGMLHGDFYPYLVLLLNNKFPINSTVAIECGDQTQLTHTHTYTHTHTFNLFVYLLCIYLFITLTNSPCKVDRSNLKEHTAQKKKY